MEVTSVRKVRSRYLIEIGSEHYRIPASLYLERPLQPGDEVDIGEYDQWLLLRQYRPALEYAVSLLAARPYAEAELSSRLRRLGYRPTTCEMVIYKLRRHALLNDTDFAQQWAAAKAARNLGPRRIAQELRQKGVSREDADAALAGLDTESQQHAADSLAEKALRKSKPGDDPRRNAQRILAMLARRGYPYDIAKAALRSAIRSAGSGSETTDSSNDP